MEQSIINLIEEVKKTYKDIGQNSSQAFQYRKQKKNGYAQACMVRVRYLHRKLLGLKQQLISLIKGNVAFIKYEVIDKNNNLENRDAILVNMSDSDIHTTIQLYCQVSELKLNKILEIKRISTKLG